MRSSTIPSHFLNFIEERIIRVMFEKSKICIYCNEKKNFVELNNYYFTFLKSEINRREGYELYGLLNHLENIQKLMTKEYLMEFIFSVIVPTFEDEKEKYLNDVENHQESRLIAASCLRIITENSNDDDILAQFLSINRIINLRDCTLIPAMSLNACVILSYGMNNPEKQAAIKSIFFENILYLIHEITSIYNQIGIMSKRVKNKHEDDEEENGADFEILDQQMVMIKENLSNLDILLLNTVHWDIMCELMLKYPNIQEEFVTNLKNSFSKNILFKIACSALKTLLLKRNIYNVPLKKICNLTEEMDLSKQLLDNDYCLANHPNSIICTSLDLNYEQLIREFDLFEISQKFSDKLKNEANEIIGYCAIYRLQKRSKGDKETFINLSVHRDNFLPESLSDDYKSLSSTTSSYHHPQHWINSFRVGAAFYDSSRSIRDVFVKILNRLIRPDEELKAMHRKNLINEITGKFGIKYLSAIARNCFDISFRLSSHNFSEYILFNEVRSLESA